MAFGLSADPDRTLMQGADVTVAWVDRTSVANAEDYHLSGYTQVGKHSLCFLQLLSITLVWKVV